MVVTIGLTRVRYEVPLREIARMMAQLIQLRTYDIQRPTQEQVERELMSGRLSPEDAWFRLDEEVIMYAASHWQLVE